jgi:hypothetical protein
LPDVQGAHRARGLRVARRKTRVDAAGMLHTTEWLVRSKGRTVAALLHRRSFLGQACARLRNLRPGGTLHGHVATVLVQFAAQSLRHSLNDIAVVRNVSRQNLRTRSQPSAFLHGLHCNGYWPRSARSV